VPVHLQLPAQASDTARVWASNPSCAMQQYSTVCEKESSKTDSCMIDPLILIYNPDLLYIHRNYFFRAIREDSQNPMRHIYASSVLATYRSACRLISSLQGLYSVHPARTGRVWFFWSCIFSSCVSSFAVIGFMTRYGPSSQCRSCLVHSSLKALGALFPATHCKNWNKHFHSMKRVRRLAGRLLQW
jgi:hypothetical protein